MSLARTLRHLMTPPWAVKRAFPATTLAAIEQAIRQSEATHAGELRFVVEGALSGAPLFHNQPDRERAIDLFSQLRMWDTEARNGVLIYLLMADRAVEIVADRGVHARAGEAAWELICKSMEAAFHDGRYEAGALEGIAAITALLAQHYPAGAPRANELPDAVVLL